jgi:hypothetical protein
MLNPRIINNMRLLAFQITQAALREFLNGEQMLRNLAFAEPKDQRYKTSETDVPRGMVFVKLGAIVVGGEKFVSTCQFWRNEEGWHLGEVDMRYGPEKQFFLRQPALVQRPNSTRYIDLYQRGLEGEPKFWDRLKSQGHEHIFTFELLVGQPVEGELVLEDELEVVIQEGLSRTGGPPNPNPSLL